MKPHEIKVEELLEWLDTSDVEFASSTRERKRLIYALTGTFRVVVAGRKAWAGTDPKEAVEAYNAITAKYIEEKPILEL